MSASTNVRPDLTRLNEIAQSPAFAESDDLVLELVEHMADEPDGLSLLIGHYLDVPNAIVPRAIAFVLAERAATPTSETWRQTLDLVGRLRGSSDPSTLINGLTAIQRHLILFGRHGVRTAAQASPLLDDFLLHSLGQSTLVQATAIDILIRMADDRLLIPVFGRSDAARLRLRLTEMAANGETDRREEVDQLIASLPAGER